MTGLQGDISAGGIMGMVGGKHKSVSFAKKKIDFKFYLSIFWEEE